MPTPTVLLIVDGWGQAPAGPGNAVSQAKMPNLDKLIAQNPHCLLSASGRDVGLPSGFMGNSEVGHLNIGAGRVVYQDMTRIDDTVAEGGMGRNPVLAKLLRDTASAGGSIHFAGLLSDGGVHSHITHLTALIKAAKEYDVPVLVHAFLDGRDTSPKSASGFVRRLEEHMATMNWGRIASVCGRYYAMDRDKRWERRKVAWDAMVNGAAAIEPNAEKAIEDAYRNGTTDEFILPCIIPLPDGSLPVIRDKDSLFFFNFRADRARLLVRPFIMPDFAEFDRGHCPKLTGIATMTQYDAAFDVPVAFPKENLVDTMGEAVSKMQAKQLRIAETEKYAHVTYFFNGGREEPFENEERILIPSPKNVATYDLAPAMSAREVTDSLIAEWKTGKYLFAVCNLANLDMVGHTGVMRATIEACEITDECVGRIARAVKDSGGRLIITADHGNAEQMLDANNTPQTAHSTNKVLFILVEPDSEKNTRSLHDGRLGDIAPTILDLWGVKQPEAMTGKSLLEKNNASK